MKPCIEDDICHCCAHLGKDYADPCCEDCEGTGKSPESVSRMRSLYNKLLRRKNNEQIQR